MVHADVVPAGVGPTAAKEMHPLLSLLTASFSVTFWFLQWIRTLVAFVTITVPIWIYAILSYSFTLRLDFWSLVSIFVVSVASAIYYIRWRQQEDWSELREPPLNKPDVKELHPDVQGEEPPPAFHNYLDEFLSAVRIFGFLEKPVFHELARHLQTRRLIAGDSLSLDQDQSFYCVVDGLVQVFAPSGRPADDGAGENDAWAEEEMNGYQLINEVGSGGTLSSLFTILNLFTEDIKLRWNEDQEDIDEEQPDTGEDSSMDENASTRKAKARVLQPNLDVSELDLLSTSPQQSRVSQSPSFSRPAPRLQSPRPFATPSQSQKGSMLFESTHSTFSPQPMTPRGSSFNSPFGFTPSVRDLRINSPAHTSSARSKQSKTPIVGRGTRLNTLSTKQGLVARATVDTTLAVIPAEAFRRLTQKFPKASAHIVQVILTRFSRVTFNAAHRYLGLTTEVLRTEKAINELACHPLPASFYEGGGMQALRARFAPDVDIDDEVIEDEDDQLTGSSTTGGVDSDDYFGYEPIAYVPPGTRTPMLASRTRMSTLSPSVSRHAPRTLQSSASSSTLNGRGSGTFSPKPAPSPVRRTNSGITVSQPRHHHGPSSRTHITAGDLLSSTTTDTAYFRPHSQSISNVNTPAVRSSSFYTTPSTLGSQFPTLPTPVQQASRLPHPASPRSFSSNYSNMSSVPGMTAPKDIDLRDEVMACIAKSIGLIQPPLSSATGSRDNSPVLSALGGGGVGGARSPLGSIQSGTVGGARGDRFKGPFTTPFTPLSLLETGDDMTASSVTGSSVQGLMMNKGDSPYATGLDNEVEILCFAAGSVLVRAGERNAGLFYVIDGFLDVSIPTEDAQTSGATVGHNPTRTSDASRPLPSSASTTSISGGARWGEKGPTTVQGKSGARGAAGPNPPTQPFHSKTQKISKHLFTVKPGGIAGYLSSLSGIPSYVEIRAKVDTYVGFLPSHALERLLEKRPIVLLTLSKRLISLLSPLVLHIDSALDWMQVNAGQVLWRPGDASDSFYIVINGRLRAITDKDGEDGAVEILGEYGQGDTVGELDVITSSERRTTVHAIRDTELARMPRTLFNAISVRHPQATVQLLRMIATRVRKNTPGIGQPKKPGSATLGTARNNLNLKTVAILPSTRSIPIAAFARKLQTALEDIGAPTAYLNQASLSGHLGRHAFTRMGKLKVAAWLADQEQRYRIVLYVADSPVNAPWTQTCIRQADYVMVVGLGDDPTMGEYERLLLTTKTTARKELVLLHSDRSVVPGSTREWLKTRPWAHAHIHVELPGILPSTPAPILRDPAPVEAFKNLKNKVQEEIQKYRGISSAPRTTRRPNHLGDFARLARRLCGKSIGVILGGGGARGIAHLGLLRALEERSIPVDQIGGTSIGAFVGGLYAREGSLISCSGRMKAWSARMGNIWRLLSDLTWPVVAYSTGHEFNRGIYKAYGALHIEDMWLPYFCNTTNILTSRMEIHETGYAWRYIRASMSLVGLLPPLCDNGDMLVDGGYLDNLPVSTMISMGANTVFACDVGSLDDNSPRNYGDTVSGWWLLVQRWNPFASVSKIPAITEIQSRLAYVSSVATLEEAKTTPGCLYIQPPVQAFGTLQFGKFEEIAEVGYKGGIELLDQWKEQGKLPTGFASELHDAAEKSKKRKGRAQRRNSI